MQKTDGKISRFLSLILRHEPEKIGLKLDVAGWASIAELKKKCGFDLSTAQLERVVRDNNKQRFAISADGRKIRANQGHSIDIDLGLSATQPPEFLFHGTASKYMGSILKNGLDPQTRQYVHLSDTIDTAISVGSRRGNPIIFQIPALEMHQSGYAFFLAHNGVWLSRSVPSKYLLQIR
jgi:putative RNA 2'-phosphotransferase